jgi:hypothetical protein
MLTFDSRARQNALRMLRERQSRGLADAPFTVDEAFEWVGYQHRLILDRHRGDWRDAAQWAFYDGSYKPVLARFESVAAIAPLYGLYDDAKRDRPSTDQLRLAQYGRRHSLWRADSLWDEICLNNGAATAVLVEPNVIMTAAHVLESFDPCATDPGKIFFAIFGFRPEKDWRLSSLALRDSRVFKIKRVIPRPNGNPDDDWVLAELEGNVDTSRYPVVPVSDAPVTAGQAVYCLHHGHGLPARFAIGQTHEMQRDRRFRLGVELFRGASGSPLFDADTHDLVGIALKSSDRDGIHKTTIGEARRYYRVSTLCTDLEGEGGVLSTSTSDYRRG